MSKHAETDRRGGPVEPSRSTLRPLGLDEIEITGGFWGARQDLNATVILGHCQSWMERSGWIGNFDRAADGTIGDGHAGIEFVDSEVYKLLEAMAWELGRRPDAALEERYSALVARVAAAQEPDGYLHTSFGRPGQPARYSSLEWGHELYCFGHLIQASVARLRSGHDDTLAGVARRLADHVYREFGPNGRVAVCGHPEIEPALAEFSRVTGDARYLELARLFVERRGTGTLAPIQFGAEYFQDDVPVRDATVLRGHAVRALYLASGALDVAVETGDEELVSALRTQWRNTVARRMYITGGVGSHHLDEAFGEDYELPPDRAYSETCAGIASVMFSWRLLLETGETRYADLIERTLLNNILASPRDDGRAFYYTNTLHQRVDGTVPNEGKINARARTSLRAPWFEVSCCPTNVARTLASVGLYFATADGSGVQLQQYGDYSVRTTFPTGESVALDVRSGYPFDGEVVIEVAEGSSGEYSISARVPSWARGRAVLRDGDEQVIVSGDVATVRRVFRVGEQLRLSLPMEPRFTHPDPRIDAVRGDVAVERGPLVLCVESTDLPDMVDVNHVCVRTLDGLVSSDHGAVAHFAMTPAVADSSSWPYVHDATDKDYNKEVPEPREFPVELVPYFYWANRGPSTMRVWMPTAD